MNNVIEDFFTLTKGFLLISLVWFSDAIVVELSLLTFLPSVIKGFFIETRDIINWVVSILVLYATYLKIKKEKSKNK